MTLEAETNIGLSYFTVKAAEEAFDKVYSIDAFSFVEGEDNEMSINIDGNVRGHDLSVFAVLHKDNKFTSGISVLSSPLGDKALLLDYHSGHGGGIYFGNSDEALIHALSVAVNETLSEPPKKKRNTNKKAVKKKAS